MSFGEPRFIGWLIARPGNRLTRTYETAAWYDEYEVDPGVYPVYESHEIGGYWTVGHAHGLPATYRAGCSVSLYGGVPFGNDPAKAKIGTRATVSYTMQRHAWGNESAEFEARNFEGLEFVPITGNAECGRTMVRSGRDVHRRKTKHPLLDHGRRETYTFTRRLRLLPPPA